VSTNNLDHLNFSKTEQATAYSKTWPFCYQKSWKVNSYKGVVIVSTKNDEGDL